MKSPAERHQHFDQVFTDVVPLRLEAVQPPSANHFGVAGSRLVVIRKTSLSKSFRCRARQSVKKTK